jgi:hypothetical protein
VVVTGTLVHCEPSSAAASEPKVAIPPGAAGGGWKMTGSLLDELSVRPRRRVTVHVREWIRQLRSAEAPRLRVVASSRGSYTTKFAIASGSFALSLTAKTGALRLT